jgi:cytochrome c biogenesis protein CcmG/thiol:disulfide interchange protein DsbE
MRFPIVLTAALAFALLPCGCDRGDHPQQLNTAAPTFTLSDGQHSIDLAHLRGHVVLLNFWASWCAPCLEELPSLEALHQQLPQLDMVGISIDDDRAAYEVFLQAHHVDFLTVIDPDQRVNALYGTFRPPETYVIDKNGVIRRKFIGPQAWTSPEILDYLRKLSAS